MQAPAPAEREVAIDGKPLRSFYGDNQDVESQPCEHPAQQQLAAAVIGTGTFLGHVGFSGQKDPAEGAAPRQVALSLPQ